MPKPTTYTPEVVERVYQYLDEYQAQGDAIPSVAGLASYLKKSRRTLYLWKSVTDDEGELLYPDYVQALDDVMSAQERALLNGGLTGDLTASIVKLALGQHGYSDRVDQTVSGGDTPIKTKHTVEFIRVSQDA